MAYNNYKSYSRLNRIEDNKSKRTIIVYIVLTILFLLFLVFAAPRILGLIVGSLNTDNPESLSSDTTAPSPPRVNTPPQFTNATSITISGSAEPNSTVAIFNGNDKTETVADDSGNFSVNIDLDRDENTIYAKAIDLAGNESPKSSTYTITYDNEKPEVEVTKPTEGQQFFGQQQRQLTLEGKTEPDAKVTINDRFVIVDSNGNFKFNTNLGDGENSFNIKSTDQAGNLTELTIKVNFTP